MRSNFLECWLGLSRILVQTASGNTGAEMVLEGLVNFEDVRDFLYSEMRGVRDQPAPSITGKTAPPELELAATLREVATELRFIHETLANQTDQPDA